MIKRLIIVLVSIVGIVFVPWLVGEFILPYLFDSGYFEWPNTIDDKRIWLDGFIAIIMLLGSVLFIFGIIQYIKYGE